MLTHHLIKDGGTGITGLVGRRYHGRIGKICMRIA
jgi:hypothetical protein